MRSSPKRCGTDMRIEKLTPLPVCLISPSVYEDARGFFMEPYNREQLSAGGIELVPERHAHSYSHKGVVRALHFQWEPPLSKLIRVVAGRAFVAAVDIRKSSPTLGTYRSVELSAENKLLLYAPFGFANGFCALEEGTEVEYYLSGSYNPKGESTIRWNDPRVGIPWPVDNPILSPRDASAQTLEQWLARPESGRIL